LHEAATEAALSRLYGGIHYLFDDNGGLESGECIGRTIIARVNSSTEALSANAPMQANAEPLIFSTFHFRVEGIIRRRKQKGQEQQPPNVLGL